MWKKPMIRRTPEGSRRTGMSPGFNPNATIPTCFHLFLYHNMNRYRCYDIKSIGSPVSFML